MKIYAEALDLSGSVRRAELEQAVKIALFVALTALGAKVYVPHEPVPFTLQTLFVVLAGAILGWRAGIVTMLFYIGLGAAGLPVFAGVEAGPAILVGPTAGYLFGFVIAAGIVGATVGLNRSLGWTFLSMLTGFLVVFACGTLYLDAAFLHNWRLSITQGLLIFSYWDLLKLGAAVFVYRASTEKSLTKIN